MTNREWLYSLDVADLADWFNSEHVETPNTTLDGDTAALNAKIAELEKKLRVGWECECKLQAERDKARKECETYRSLLGKALDYADAIHALAGEIDEGMA